MEDYNNDGQLWPSIVGRKQPRWLISRQEAYEMIEIVDHLSMKPSNIELIRGGREDIWLVFYTFLDF